MMVRNGYALAVEEGDSSDPASHGRTLKSVLQLDVPGPAGYRKKNIVLVASCTVLTLTVLAVVLGVCLTRKSASKARDSTRLKPEFGVGTSSYQIEGAWNVDGRSPSIWDTFSHTRGKTNNNDTGDVASDAYHLYKTDFDELSRLGVRYYRFSLSWSRIVPGGSAGSPVNSKGVQYYSSVIDELLARKITPVVTLFHWDLPQSLQDKYGGWQGAEVVDDFRYYADACFRAFGARVKLWATLNEPWTFCLLGYDWGTHAPGINGGRKAGLLAGHHALLAHAAAVQVFRQQYQPKHGGRISIALNCDWSEPLTQSAGDLDAASLRTEFSLGWFANPVVRGDYPPAMRERLGASLPVFNESQKAALKGSIDYFSLNHYTSMWAYASDRPNVFWEETRQRKGRTIGPRAESEWLYAVPWGFGKLLRWVHEQYDQPEIWVTENGASEPGEGKLVVGEAAAPIKDPYRVAYFKGYVEEMERVVEEHGVDVRAYFAWSFIDNFEWADGYSCRFGIVAVDFVTQARVWKKSAEWLRDHFNALRQAGQLHPVSAA